jgi:hypothetical protein
MTTNEELVDDFNNSVKKFGSASGSLQLTDDLSLNYTTSGSDGFDATILGHLNKLKGNKYGLEMLTGLAVSGKFTWHIRKFWTKCYKLKRNVRLFMGWFNNCL